MSKFNLSIFNATSNSIQQCLVLFQWPYLMFHAMLDSMLMFHANVPFNVGFNVPFNVATIHASCL